MSTLRDFPGSLCARFADALPLYTSGELAPAEASAFRAHLETCDTCRRRLAGYDRMDAALRQHVGVPAHAAPFLSFDSIVSRTPSADPPPETAPLLEQTGGPDAEDARLVAPSPRARWRGVRPIHEEEIMYDQDEPPQAPIATVNGAQPHRRARGIAAVAAAIALVALAAAVFHSISLGATHTVGKNNKPQQTAPATHYLGASGKWDTVARYQTTAGAGYETVTVAPNNPSIVYESGPGATMRRSTDGGSTWTTVSVPLQEVPAGSAATGLTTTVSPLDANTVYAVLSSDASNPKCPKPVFGASRPHIGAKIDLSGGYSCTFEYVSTNAGSTWQSLNTPTKGEVGWGVSSFGGFATQSGWLYSLLVPDLNGPAPLGYRLVKSSDGVNWQYADGDLAAHGLTESQFVAASTGGELFAASVPANSINGGGPYTSDLWHSSDGGAHWTDVGPFLAAAEGYAQLLAATANASGRAQVYSSGVAGNGGHQQINVSSDGGRTWQPVSYSGLPADMTATATPSSGHPTPAPLMFPGGNSPYLRYVATLADGSLVMEYAHEDAIPLGTPDTNGGAGYLLTNTHIVYYALAPGASAWTQLTPQLPDGYVVTQWLSPASASHPDAIYALQMSANPNVLQSTSNQLTLTLSRCALT